MAKYVCAFLIVAHLATLVAPSVLTDSNGRTHSGHLRGIRSRAELNNSMAVPPLVPIGPTTPIKFLISSFQDGERCANTLYQALKKAQHPERITFNVLQAAGAEDTVCLEEFRHKQAPKICRMPDATGFDHCMDTLLSKIHFKVIPLEAGEGPVHQRGLLSEFADLSGDGAMCLATDSHMDFAQGWDSDLLEDWASTGNEFAVLSAYPFATMQMEFSGAGGWIELCGYFLTSQGIPRGATARPVLEDKKMGTPQLTMNWAAGQSFARCHAERNVPADKHLAWMFDGEEVNRAVRFWTHGYDLYNPRVSVVFHNYSNAAQKFWSYSKPNMKGEKRASEMRLKRLLQGEAPTEANGKYGLGDQRSLSQYVTWAHTDLGGKWGQFLAGQGITPHFSDFVSTGSYQPQGVPEFCNKLQRLPVRDRQVLVQSAMRQGAGAEL